MSLYSVYVSHGRISTYALTTDSQRWVYYYKLSIQLQLSAGSSG
jgi:hypothetical protein